MIMKEHSAVTCVSETWDGENNWQNNGAFLYRVNPVLCALRNEQGSASLALLTQLSRRTLQREQSAFSRQFPPQSLKISYCQSDRLPKM